MVFVLIGTHRIDSILNVSIIIDQDEDLLLLPYIQNILPLVQSMHIYLSESFDHQLKEEKIDPLLHQNPQEIKLYQYGKLTELNLGRYHKHLVISPYTISETILKLNKKLQLRPTYLFVQYKKDITDNNKSLNR
jgi:hypothetical protein